MPDRQPASWPGTIVSPDVMPSYAHEFLVEMFRECPSLAPELLRRATELELPVGTVPRTAAAEISGLDVAEHRADAVIRLDDRDGEAREVIITEVQMDRDRDKPWTWPHYVTGMRVRFRCRTSLLVVAMDHGIACWCARRAIRYADFVMASLGDLARRALEQHMDILGLRNYQFQSDFIRKNVELGRKEGLRDALLRLLEQRFDELPAEVRQRIEGAEMSELERWIDRVITAAALDDVFADE